VYQDFLENDLWLSNATQAFAAASAALPTSSLLTQKRTLLSNIFRPDFIDQVRVLEICNPFAQCPVVHHDVWAGQRGWSTSERLPNFEGLLLKWKMQRAEAFA
jgi:hypothetical protein